MSPLAVAPVAKTYYHWPHRWETVGWGTVDASTDVVYERSQLNTKITGGDSREAGANADGGETWTWYPAIDGGTYTLMVMHATNPAHGIVTISLDGVDVLVGSAGAAGDFYGAAALLNVVTTVTGITVPRPGVKTLTFTVTGKNPSSSDFVIALQLISLVRTGS